MLAYVVYEMTAVYTVDLARDQVRTIELYSSEMRHLDTGLEQPERPNWRQMHARAREVVEREPRTVAPKWSTEE